MTLNIISSRLKPVIFMLLILILAAMPVMPLYANDPHVRDIRQTGTITADNLLTPVQQSAPQAPVGLQMPNLFSLFNPAITSLFGSTGSSSIFSLGFPVPGSAATPSLFGLLPLQASSSIPSATKKNQSLNQTFKDLIKTACAMPDIGGVRKDISITSWDTTKTTPPKKAGAKKTIDDICSQVNSTGTPSHLGQINFQY